MKVSAFTYVRNGLRFDYPFIEAIKSVLPLVDEFIVVIGDSTDGTREAVEAIHDQRIRIVDTIWDPNMLSGGLVFAQQSNIGLDNISKDSDWVFHIQADELIHEKDLPIIQKAMQDYLHDEQTEGFLFPFINFFGDYWHYAPSRRFHQHEIRILRNNPHYRSYKDSQGFRWFDNPANQLEEKGRKLKVRKIEPAIYHYSWAKPPKFQQAKRMEFGNRYYGTGDPVNYEDEGLKELYNYREFDYLKKFTGTHPALMKDRITNQIWEFKYDPSKHNMNLKEKVLKLVEDVTGKQFFIYKNYKLIR